jgi:osmoprotectant transport system ATP-binding protein
MHQKFGAGRLGYARMLTPVGLGVNRNGCESLYVTDTTIEFQNVEYQIDIRELRRSILSDVSLKIHQGETIALLGRSGSGKTTMLKLINRLRNCTAGDLLVEGLRVQDWNPIQLRRRIGYVIQEVGLFPHLTIQENVSLVPALENWPAERSASRYAEVMQLVGLNAVEYANRYPRELSGGQRQRVGVARALAADPAILLMDEPFGALDPVTRAELQQEFLALARKVSKTIVLVTHDLREALLLGTRVVLLHEGRIIAQSTPQEFLRLDQPVAREFIAASELVLGAAK